MKFFFQGILEKCSLTFGNFAREKCKRFGIEAKNDFLRLTGIKFIANRLFLLLEYIFSIKLRGCFVTYQKSEFFLLDISDLNKRTDD